jgi:hypothetical protein
MEPTCFSFRENVEISHSYRSITCLQRTDIWKDRYCRGKREVDKATGPSIEIIGSIGRILRTNKSRISEILHLSDIGRMNDHMTLCVRDLECLIGNKNYPKRKIY